MSTIAIHNGRIFDGENFVGRGGVLVENGRIAAVGGEYPADKTFDAGGAVIAPGLVDVHGHFRGLSPDKYATSADGSCFPFGVTAAADCGVERGSVEVMEALGVQCVGFLAVPILDGAPRWERPEALLRTLGERAVGFKVVYDRAAVDDIRPLEAVVRRARALGLKVTVHTTGSPVPMAEIVDALGAGDILTHAYHGGANTSAEDGFACLKTAQRKGVIVDAGMAWHVHTDFSVLRAAVAAETAPDVIGTDVTRLSTYTRGGRYGMAACMSLARHAGMDETAVFRAVTASAARALGKEKEWGRLEVGRVADLAVIADDGPGFVFRGPADAVIASETGYRCRLTVASGDVVFAE